MAEPSRIEPASAGFFTPIVRPEGWESRLAAVIKQATARAYDARRWNCARFAHQCAQAVSGRAIPFVWKGSLEASADAALARIDPRLARAGDVVLANVPEPSLGVCTGRVVTFIAAHGLIVRARSYILVAWAV